MPISQKFYLNFDMLAPAVMECDADGPGCGSKMRDIAGKPVLCVTGNAWDAQITCQRPDGSRYTTDANRAQFYNTAEPLRATVTYSRDRDAIDRVPDPGDDIRGYRQRCCRRFPPRWRDGVDGQLAGDAGWDE